MAHGERRGLKLVLVLTVASLLLLADGAGQGFAMTNYKTHSLTLKSMSRYRPDYQYSRSSRRLILKSLGTAKLKKSSFWNSKPFQFSTPVVSGDMLFIGVDAHMFYGIDANKVKKRWTYQTEGPVQSRALVDGDVVYFGDAKGFAYAVSASDGKEVWKTFVDSPILSSPLIIGDRVYLVSETGRLFALNRGSGQQLLSTEPIYKSAGFSIRRTSNPVYFNGKILFGTSTGTLIAYGEGGSIAWVKQLGNRQDLVYDLDSEPLIDGNNIYLTTADRNVFCLDGTNGTVVWSNSETGGPNDLALSEGRLFASGGGVLAAIMAADGSVIWEQDFEIPEISSPSVYDKIVAVADTKEKFYLVDTDTGDVILERFIKKGSFGDPLFVGDRVYLIANTGLLYGFSVKEKAAKAPAKAMK